MTPLTRIKNYEQMGIGLFIHWGLYSQLEQGEWTEFIHELNQTKYEKLIDSFTASDFDARELVQQAKKMGANYAVLTTRHHEGFFLYDTKGLSKFDVMHSPAKRDLVKEFVDACHQANIQPFLYVATYDWHTPLYSEDFNAYLQYLNQAVKLLCTNYGEIGGFWFDGNWNKKDANWHLDKLYGIIRKYQPNAVIINNTGLKERGKVSDPEIDVVTYERGTPDLINHGAENEKYVAGEMSLTLNQHWGYAKNDLNYKSPNEIISSICHARNIGANILINIGLKGQGAIPAMAANYLQLIGKWTHMAAPALYAGRPSTIQASQNEDFVLQTKDYLYLFIFNLKIVGNSNVVLGGEGVNLRSFVGIEQPIAKIFWLDNHESLDFMQDPSNKALTVNATGFRYGTDWIVRIAQIDFKK